jgi:hypothetical protein
METLRELCPNNQAILSAISDCISTIIFFPASCYEQHMKEYSQLWSFAFHYSLLDHQWLSALEAIMSNPRREVQSMEFKKLVLTMVEACVFGSILEFIPIAGNSIDFFELAVDSLTDGATSSLITNVYYSGCLFALHASRKNCGCI